jgi:hypothetical protein
VQLSFFNIIEYGNWSVNVSTVTWHFVNTMSFNEQSIVVEKGERWCNICSSQLSTPSNLRKHLVRVHKLRVEPLRAGAKARFSPATKKQRLRETSRRFYKNHADEVCIISGVNEVVCSAQGLHLDLLIF